MGTRRWKPGPGERAEVEAKKIDKLSNREREIIGLVGEGLKDKQIAERLSINDEAVRHHLNSVYDKLEVSDRLELLIYAYRHGLARVPGGEEADVKP
jgi:DNA-binding NarL/FixJ family response regulator